MSRKPNFENRVFSADQKKHQSRFQEAAAYAKTAAKTEPIYTELAAGTAKSAYNVTVGDWFKPPEVGEIDVRRYTGQAGETVRAKVTDDVMEEQGEMSLEQGLWYTYTTTTNCPVGMVKMVVTGLDLPGHEGSAEATLTVEKVFCLY